MAEAVEAAHRIRVPKGWLEDDLCTQLGDQTGLPGDAELGGEVTSDTRDGHHMHMKALSATDAGDSQASPAPTSVRTGSMGSG